MERKPYSAGAVKFSFWFMEFRKTVQLLSEGKSFADIKKLNEETNIYGAPTKLRAQQIYSTVTARIKTLPDGSSERGYHLCQWRCAAHLRQGSDQPHQRGYRKIGADGLPQAVLH